MRNYQSTLSARTGITLLEVLIALAIFLISLIGVGHLITLSGQQTLEVSERGHGAQMAHVLYTLHDGEDDDPPTTPADDPPPLDPDPSHPCDTAPYSDDDTYFA